MANLRIGILRSQYRKLADWEVRLISEIQKIEGCEIVLLIGDKRKMKIANINRPQKRISLDRIISYIRAQATRFSAKNIAWNILNAHEERYISKRIRISEDIKAQVNEFYMSLPAIYLSPEKRGKNLCIDFFNKDETELLRPFQLDLILRHEFGFIKGNILDIAKHGIWSLHHGDNSINRGGPPGFWECYYNEEVAGVTLQRLTEELDGGKVISKSWHPLWGKKYLPTKHFLLESSVELVLKELKLLTLGTPTKETSSLPYSRNLFVLPNLQQILVYVWKTYIHTPWCYRIRKLRCRGLSNTTGKWQIHIQRGNFMGSALYKSKILPTPTDEFWADPFVIEHSGQSYLYFEAYSYTKKYAAIKCVAIDHKGNLAGDPVSIFPENHHRSYPFIYKRKDQYYLLPESVKSKRLEIWKAHDMPYSWSLSNVALEGFSVGDPTIYLDNHGQEWLFANMSHNPYGDHDSYLYIYRIDNWDTFSLTPHKLNPVIINPLEARSAGNIFTDANGTVIRPVQQKVWGEYGKRLALMRIDELTIESFRQTLLTTLDTSWDYRLDRIHHVSSGLSDKWNVFDTMSFP